VKGEKMELVELLDKIDETAPRSCEMCLYMATHEKCDGCLFPNNSDGTFPYTNYIPGNWLRRLDEFEKAGELNIVIGGQGEAEVNVKWTPKETTQHLHRVAEQCGYSCGNLIHKENGLTTLDIYTTEGLNVLTWDKDNKLLHIFSGTSKNSLKISWPLI